MTDNIWPEIQKSLEKLLRDPTMTRFHPLIEDIGHWASASRYPLETIRAFVDLIRQMGEDVVKHGKSIEAVFEQATTRTGTYYQPSWDVDKVYQTNGHFFQLILNNWREKVEPDPIFQLPIVLLVMHSKEAHELASGAAFQEYPDELHEDFRQLHQLLVSHNMENWVQNYKQEATAWKPFKDRSETIEQLVRYAASRIKDAQKQIVPNFIDIRILNKEQNRTHLHELRKGCVVIFDAISMYHPKIQRQFRQSLLDAFPNTVVACVTPGMDIFHLEQRMITVIEKRTEMELFKRMSQDWDDRCRRIFNRDDFGQWFTKYAPELLLKKPVGIIEHFYEAGR